MQKRQGSSADTLRGVRDFLDVHADRLQGVVAPEIRRELDDVIAAAAGHVASQSEGRLAGEGATRKQRALRRVLREEHMAPVAAIAGAKLPVTPEVEPLRMPPQSAGVAKLAAHAHGMAATATQFTTVFTNAGLRASLARGRQVVRILDAVVSKALKDETGLLAGWKNVKRVVHPPGRRAVVAGAPGSGHVAEGVGSSAPTTA